MYTADHGWGIPDNKVHGANMGSIWGRQNPGGSHVDPRSLASWDILWLGRIFEYFARLLLFTFSEQWQNFPMFVEDNHQVEFEYTVFHTLIYVENWLRVVW